MKVCGRFDNGEEKTRGVRERKKRRRRRKGTEERAIEFPEKMERNGVRK